MNNDPPHLVHRLSYDDSQQNYPPFIQDLCLYAAPNIDLLGWDSPPDNNRGAISPDRVSHEISRIDVFNGPSNDAACAEHDSLNHSVSKFSFSSFSDQNNAPALFRTFAPAHPYEEEEEEESSIAWSRWSSHWGPSPPLSLRSWHSSSEEDNNEEMEESPSSPLYLSSNTAEIDFNGPTHMPDNTQYSPLCASSVEVTSEMLQPILAEIRRRHPGTMSYVQQAILAQIQPFIVHDQEAQVLVSQLLANPPEYSLMLLMAVISPKYVLVYLQAAAAHCRAKNAQMLTRVAPFTAMSAQKSAASAQLRAESARPTFDPVFILSTPLTPDTAAFYRLAEYASLTLPDSLQRIHGAGSAAISQKHISKGKAPVQPPPGQPARESFASALETLSYVATASPRRVEEWLTQLDTP
ncbi:hypothetical protein CPB97_009562 [Podila verticillata]|nr:hypothetical protein CPB97_009562 [Podila verticillata]